MALETTVRYAIRPDLAEIYLNKRLNGSDLDAILAETLSGELIRMGIDVAPYPSSVQDFLNTTASLWTKEFLDAFTANASTFDKRADGNGPSVSDAILESAPMDYWVHMVSFSVSRKARMPDTVTAAQQFPSHQATRQQEFSSQEMRTRSDGVLGEPVSPSTSRDYAASHTSTAVASADSLVSPTCKIMAVPSRAWA